MTISSRPGSVLIFMLGLFLAACGTASPSPANSQMASPTAIIESIQAFEAAIQQAANTVDRQAAVETERSLRGYSYLVNGHPVIALESAEGVDNEAASVGMAEFAQELGPATHYWRSGGLAVFYAGDEGGLILLISGLLGDSQTLQAPVQDEPYPPAVLSAIQHVSQETDMDPSEIQVESFVKVTWPDSCLGMRQPDEGCTESLVEGWQIQLRTQDRSWQVHTDEFGQRVRSQ